MKRIPFVAVAIVSVAYFGLYGCGRATPTEPGPSGTAPASHEHADHMGEGQNDHGAEAGREDEGQSDMEKMATELAKLSAEDRASAEKQHFCPVSGKMLGAMGPPQKVDVNGQQVWICCSGCKDQLFENPEDYLAKLNKDDGQ